MLLACLHLVAHRVGSSHGLRNEMHFRLKELHRLVQCSRFLLVKDQKYLCLMESGESGRMLSSQITDELKLVAHPVGTPRGMRNEMHLSGKVALERPSWHSGFL